MRQWVKKITLFGAKRFGVLSIVRESAWRRHRLVILCYHGVSIDDEHEWNPWLYHNQSLFSHRLSMLKNGGYRILHLKEAIDRLYTGDLPCKSAAITFDDGFHDFYKVAYPLLIKYNIPATVYLTTYYMLHQRPIFNVMISYLLWKGRNKVLEIDTFESGSRVALASVKKREEVADHFKQVSRSRGLSGPEKDELLAELAHRLEIDYTAITKRRLLHIMSPDEVKKLDPKFAQVELHTHRHRVPLDQTLFCREIEENRASLESISDGVRLEHLAYPSGVTDPLFLPWLKDLGVRSATTCESGLATRRDDPLMLPRVLDTSMMSDSEFEAWLTGLPALLSMRSYWATGPNLDRSGSTSQKSATKLL
jgi:peptidoglycan/xylan/chitin deacetylase (PgdA/CDA1 family)